MKLSWLKSWPLSFTFQDLWVKIHSKLNQIRDYFLFKISGFTLCKSLSARNQPICYVSKWLSWATFFKCLLNLGCITLDRGRKWKWTRWSLESLSGQIETGISRVHGPIAYKICSLPSPYTFGVGSHYPLFKSNYMMNLTQDY